ncbi:FAD:protein FMN transferase [candidate division KSB1 bacterium]|nr:FAD:protein FMN transferase [candidate division KSB1 bacterium]
MNYKIAVDPELKISAPEFIEQWNTSPECQPIARVQSAVVTRGPAFDPTLLQQGLIALGGFTAGLAVDVLKDVIKEQVKAYLKRKFPAPTPQVKVDAIQQPDGSYLLVVNREK